MGGGATLYRICSLNPTLLVIVGFGAVSLFGTSCRKEVIAPPAVGYSAARLSGVSDRDRGNEETAAIAQHLHEIQSFRTKVAGWRTQTTSETLPAEEVAQKTEVAFNYNLGDPISVFESYATSETKISVAASSGVWSSGTIVAFYDAVKAKVKTELEGGPNRTLRLLSLGIPTQKDGGYEVDIFVMTGVNKVDGPPADITHDGTRWTGGTFGFIANTPCGASANNDIGAAANNQIGFYQPINAGPGSGGNTQVRVVSFITQGEHNLFGAGFPSGTNFPTAYPPVSTIGTFKQVLHYNSIAFDPNLPPLNCLSNFQLINYTFGNIQLGSSMLPVPPLQLGTSVFPRVLVATVVAASADRCRIPSASGDIDINVQEHPTRHFYAVLGRPVVVDDGAVCCVPIEEM
jgi:hypothetical protein